LEQIITQSILSQIFARVRNYSIYRIAATLQMVFFFFFAVIAFKGSVTTSFPDSQREVAETKVSERSERALMKNRAMNPATDGYIHY
jgi:hypothetical protein